jgi:hypothetical protein
MEGTVDAMLVCGAGISVSFAHTITCRRYYVPTYGIVG